MWVMSENPVMTFPIKKRINTEQGLYIHTEWYQENFLTPLKIRVLEIGGNEKIDSCLLGMAYMEGKDKLTADQIFLYEIKRLDTKCS